MSQFTSSTYHLVNIPFIENDFNNYGTRIHVTGVVPEPGYVTRAEFKRLFAAQAADVDAQLEEMKQAFKVFDKDNR